MALERAFGGLHGLVRSGSSRPGAWRLCVALLLGAVGCGQDETTLLGLGAAAEAETGALSIRLVTQAPSGARYRLLGAQLGLTDVAGETLILSPSTELETYRATVPVGSYQAELYPGWRLERADTDGVPLPALLVSPNPSGVVVSAGAQSTLVLRFRLADPAKREEGDLAVSLEVDDTALQGAGGAPQVVGGGGRGGGASAGGGTASPDACEAMGEAAQCADPLLAMLLDQTLARLGGCLPPTRVPTAVGEVMACAQSRCASGEPGCQLPPLESRGSEVVAQAAGFAAVASAALAEPARIGLEALGTTCVLEVGASIAGLSVSVEPRTEATQSAALLVTGVESGQPEVSVRLAEGGLLCSAAPQLAAQALREQLGSWVQQTLGSEFQQILSTLDCKVCAAPECLLACQPAR